MIIAALRYADVSDIILDWHEPPRRGKRKSIATKVSRKQVNN
jgi:hypothetical protein